jgi:hypothetical protein
MGVQKRPKVKRVCDHTFLRTATGNASNSSPVMPEPVICFISFLYRPAMGMLLDENGLSKDCVSRLRGGAKEGNRKELYDSSFETGGCSKEKGPFNCWEGAMRFI